MSMKIYDNQVGSFVHSSAVYAKSIISQYYFYYFWPFIGYRQRHLLRIARLRMINNQNGRHDLISIAFQDMESPGGQIDGQLVALDFMDVSGEMIGP
jgi:hypothetical protein